MPSANENDDTRIVAAIGDESATSQPVDEKAAPEPMVRDSTPTIIRGDEPTSDESSSTESSESTQKTGLEGTRYQVVHAIGEGGMGTVYLAEQLHPIRRRVAIKVVRKGPDLARFKKRFVNERQALARLDHPHIAKFLDSGQTVGGRPYYVMEFVPGIPITQFCDYHQLDLRQRIKLFIQVCDAVAHAHTKAIIHRDLKPSNVLAYMEVSTPVVKVIDFGLAKVMQSEDESLHQTKHGAIIGSSYYMSPEQANGSADVDTRSDVYALGVILYELLAGVRPFEISMFPKASELEFLRLMSSTSAPTPSARLADLPDEDQDKIARRRQLSAPQLVKVLAKELEWIPLKALRHEPERRYDGPNELAEDIRRYLASEALHAGPEAMGYRLSKFLRKNSKWVIAIASVAVFLLVAIAAVGVMFLRSAQKQAKLDEALQSTLKNQSMIEDRLARELSARLSVEMKARLKDPAYLQTLMADAAAANGAGRAGGAGNALLAPHNVWQVANPPATIRSLWDLVSWSIAQARDRFALITIPPRETWPKPGERGPGLPLAEGLNLLTFAEAINVNGQAQISRMAIYVYCTSEEEFTALSATTRSMLKRSGFEQASASSGTKQVFSTGSVEISFQYPAGRRDSNWGVIHISTALLPQ